jgi:hypothetical protein
VRSNIVTLRDGRRNILKGERLHFHTEDAPCTVLAGVNFGINIYLTYVMFPWGTAGESSIVTDQVMRPEM